MNPFLPRLSNLNYHSPTNTHSRETLVNKVKTATKMKERNTADAGQSPKSGRESANDEKVKIVWPSSRIHFKKSPDHRISAKRIWPYEISKGSALNADLEAVQARRNRKSVSKRLRPIPKKLDYK